MHLEANQAKLQDPVPRLSIQFPGTIVEERDHHKQLQPETTSKRWLQS